MKYKLKENIEQEEDSIEKHEKKRYDLVLTPNVVSIIEVIKALENIDNYGPYTSNLRNSTANVNKAVEDHFGPNQPWIKKKLEKERGKPFPPKTKQAIDTFIRTISSKPNLLKWKVDAESIVFPSDKNPNKKTTENIIQTIMDNAGIDYFIEEKESINESKLKTKILEIIEEDKLFNIKPELSGKIYDILKKEYPQISQDHTKSSFFFFLNNKLA